MSSIIRTGAIIASALLFLLFLYLILNGAASTSYITVAVVLAFTVLATRLDDITDLKFGATGVAAALKRQLREAQATIQQLQNIAEVFAQISIQEISMSNRLDGLKPREKREAIAKIEQGLKAIELPKDRIKRALLVQRPFDDFDYYHWTMSPVWHDNDPKTIGARNAFRDRFPDKGIGSNPNPAEVEAFLNSNGWNKGEIAERLKDWAHYLEDGTHRRLELWEKRHEEKIDRLHCYINQSGPK